MITIDHNNKYIDIEEYRDHSLDLNQIKIRVRLKDQSFKSGLIFQYTDTVSLGLTSELKENLILALIHHASHLDYQIPEMGTYPTKQVYSYRGESLNPGSRAWWEYAIAEINDGRYDDL